MHKGDKLGEKGVAGRGRRDDTRKVTDGGKEMDDKRKTIHMKQKNRRGRQRRRAGGRE